MSSKSKESEELRQLLKVQIEVLCALNREVGKNIVKLVKLEKVDAIVV